MEDFFNALPVDFDELMDNLPAREPMNSQQYEADAIADQLTS